MSESLPETSHVTNWLHIKSFQAFKTVTLQTEDPGLLQRVAMYVDANISEERAASVNIVGMSTFPVQAALQLTFSQSFSPAFFKPVLRVPVVVRGESSSNTRSISGIILLIIEL